jgi:CheY-like chemotaxis protein
MAKRLLLVDDEKSFTLSLRRKLELCGYEIEETDRGSDVFRRLLQRPFDLVLLDYMMPDVRGNRVCENIRSEERFKDLPVIVVTAYHDQDEKAVKAWGASEVMYKPVAADDLVKMIRKYLGE